MKGKVIKVERSRDVFKSQLEFHVVVAIPQIVLEAGPPLGLLQATIEGGDVEMTLAPWKPFDPRMMDDSELIETQQACAQELARRMAEDG